MKIRTDFVTNSSSANYILEIDLSSTNGSKAVFELAVSPETCFSEDGDMTAEDIHLFPKEDKGEIYFKGSAMSSARTIEELCDMLFTAAVIEGLYKDDEEYDDDDECEDNEEFYEYEMMEPTPVKDVAPITISNFLNRCKSAEISPENLRTIVVKNCKFGSGDSAMWLDCDVFLEELKKECGGNLPDDPDELLQRAVEFAKSAPVLPINDNSYELPDKIICVWDVDEPTLKQMMKILLDGNRHGKYWMGTAAREYTIDARNNTLLERHVLYLENN